MASLFVANSTIAENEAFGGAGGDTVSSWQGCYAQPEWNARGGDADAGIFNNASLTAKNVTIWNNTARGGLGGMSSTNGCPPSPLRGPSGYSAAAVGASAGASTLLVNTILGNPGSISNCVGAITDLGHNICSDNSAAFTNSASRNGIDPRLAPLADNGGPTRTMALLPASPALDQGDPAQCLATDQRGIPRPLGIACDIGAHEGTAPDCGDRWICRLQEGWIKVQLPVAPGETLILFSSYDLKAWRPLTTKTGPGLLEYLDKTAVTNSVRFFQAR